MENNKRESNGSHPLEQDFFNAYGHLGIHKLMLEDFQRTHTYKRAMLLNYRDFLGKTVLDVGAGTGILSIFATFAGAKKVYAVEGSPAAEFARKVVKENALQDKIEIIPKKIEDVDLPEKVDVIISEWMGYMLFYEDMLPSIISARDRFLKEEGKLYPSSVTLAIAPVALEAEDEIDNFWEKLSECYGVKMTSLAKVHSQLPIDSVDVCQVSPEQVVGHPQHFGNFDISSVTLEDLKVIRGHFEFDCFGSVGIDGFCVWFQVEFPSNIILSTSPFDEPTHWQQSILHVPRLPVRQGTIIKGTITIQKCQEFHRDLIIDLEYQIEGEPEVYRRAFTTR